MFDFLKSESLFSGVTNLSIKKECESVHVVGQVPWLKSHLKKAEENMGFTRCMLWVNVNPKNIEDRELLKSYKCDKMEVLESMLENFSVIYQKIVGARHETVMLQCKKGIFGGQKLFILAENNSNTNVYVKVTNDEKLLDGRKFPARKKVYEYRGVKGDKSAEAFVSHLYNLPENQRKYSKGFGGLQLFGSWNCLDFTKCLLKEFGGNVLDIIDYDDKERKYKSNPLFTYFKKK